MKLNIKFTPQFKKDLKKIRKQGRYDISKLDLIVSMLSDGAELPIAVKDHALKGNYSGYRECHIEPDWLLIYKITNTDLVLILFRTGSHSELF